MLEVFFEGMSLQDLVAGGIQSLVIPEALLATIVEDTCSSAQCSVLGKVPAAFFLLVNHSPTDEQV